MNKKWRKIYLAAAGVIFLFAVFMGLWFAGILSFGEKNRENAEEIGENAEETGEYAEEPENSQDPHEGWEIIFKGMKFTIPEKGMAGIHESGCMNIRQQDDYLIQIDIEDDTAENLWAHMDSKIQSLTEYGYRIEKEPEWIERDEQDYFRYIISMEDERGSDLEHTYYEVMLMPADAERRFLAVVRFDGIDMENLGTKVRDRIYDEASEAALAILDQTVPTDQKDDEAGTFWYVEKNLDPNGAYLSEDSILCDDGEWSVTYRLPENSQIVSDNVAGKTYLDTDNKIYIQTSTSHFTWMTAEEMAQHYAESHLSRIHDQGEIEIGGRTFYYYTYSVLEYGQTKMETHYYFHAYCDLGNGDIYFIYGYADDRPMAIDEMYYLDVMDITEINILQK